MRDFLHVSREGGRSTKHCTWEQVADVMNEEAVRRGMKFRACNAIVVSYHWNLHLRTQGRRSARLLPWTDEEQNLLADFVHVDKVDILA